MKYCIIVITILLWFITFVNCDKACGLLTEGKFECCAGFKYEDGKCIECPKGWFGEECNLPCPNGFYGFICKETCNCKDGQICDAQDGCVQKNIAECPKGLFGDECNLLCPDGYYDSACNETCNCTADQICDVQEGCVNNNTDNTLTIMETTSTDQQTTKSNGYHEGIVWNHLYVVSSGVVVIVLVILMVHTHRKWKTIDRESESRHDQHTEEARSQAVELNKNTDESVYDEICEFETGCSHTHTFSSDSIYFSRSRGKEVNQVQQINHTILHLDAIAR